MRGDLMSRYKNSMFNVLLVLGVLLFSGCLISEYPIFNDCYKYLREETSKKVGSLKSCENHDETANESSEFVWGAISGMNVVKIVNRYEDINLNYIIGNAN